MKFAIKKEDLKKDIVGYVETVSVEFEFEDKNILEFVVDVILNDAGEARSYPFAINHENEFVVKNELCSGAEFAPFMRMINSLMSTLQEDADRIVLERKELAAKEKEMEKNFAEKLGEAPNVS
jgi:hypothetical protein